MGLIKAAFGAIGGTLADQWKEYIYCDSLPNDVLVVKGSKRTSKRSSNTKGSENIITNGSGIVVSDGQCMIIVDQGRIVEICAEPGEYTYDMSSEPSIFSGGLGTGIKETFKTIGKDLLTAVIQETIREFIILIQKNWLTINLARRILFRFV